MNLPTIPRDLLAAAFPNQPRLVSAFENQSIAVAETAEAASGNVEATTALQEATVLTLSANATLTNERVLAIGDGLTSSDDGTSYTLSSTGPLVSGGFTVTFYPAGDAQLILPISGTLATRAGVETFLNKTLTAPKIGGLGNYANDAAAAAGGVPVTGVYRNGSVLMVRVV